MLCLFSAQPNKDFLDLKTNISKSLISHVPFCNISSHIFMSVNSLVRDAEGQEYVARVKAELFHR